MLTGPSEAKHRHRPLRWAAADDHVAFADVGELHTRVLASTGIVTVPPPALVTTTATAEWDTTADTTTFGFGGEPSARRTRATPLPKPENWTTNPGLT